MPRQDYEQCGQGTDRAQVDKVWAYLIDTV
jgi:hypothetical protein